MAGKEWTVDGVIPVAHLEKKPGVRLRSLFVETIQLNAVMPDMFAIVDLAS